MNDRPALFILAGSRSVGGAEKSLAALLPELARRAQLVVFVTSEQVADEFRRLGIPDLELVSMGVGILPWTIARNLEIYARWIRRCRPVAVLANSHRGAMLLALARLLPLLPTVHQVIYVRDFGYYTFRFLLPLLRRALFLAPTQAVFDDRRYQSWGLGQHRCQVLANAVPVPDDVSVPDSAAPRFIGCCARIVPWKGIDVLLRAFALLVARQPQARLRVYGEPIDADYYASLQALTQELKLTDHVEFCPFSNEMSGVFRQGLFFVVPSLSIVPGPETFCRIIIEAWAHARPVVAFECGGPKWLIEHGRDGYLVPEGDVQLLAERMEALLVDPVLAERLGAAGAEKVRRKYSPEAIAGELANLLFASAR